MNIPQVSAVTPSEGVVHSRLFDTPSEGVIGPSLAKMGTHGPSRHFGDSTPSEGVAHYGVFCGVLDLQVFF